MALNEKEYELLTFVEMEVSLTGLVPTRQLCLEEVPCSGPFYDRTTKKPEWAKALQSRGIRVDQSSKIVTPDQMTCINTILDRADTRSDKKKLADLGIATQTYQGWLKDPAFREYYSKRCEALFPDMTNEAHRALMDNVSRGDLGSIKLAYEMTGRWSSKTVGELNIDFLLMKVLETIQKHVTDPAALSAIADELTSYAEGPALPSTGHAQPLPLLPGVPGRPGSVINV